MSRKQPATLPPHWITAVCVALSVAAAGGVVAAGLHSVPHPLAHPAAFAVLATLLVYTHVRPMRMVHRYGAVESDHIDEALFVPMALLLSPGQFAIAVAVASLAGNITARRPTIKVLFNVGQTVLSSLVGLAVARAAGALPGAPLTVTSIFGAAGGGVVFAALSSLAVAGIVRLAAGNPLWAGVRDQWSARGVASGGALLLGVVCGIAAVSHPFALVPAVALGWFVEQAYAASVVQRQARRAAEELQAAVVTIRNSSDPAQIRADVTAAARHVLHAREASFVPSDTPPVAGELRVPVDEQTILHVTQRVGGGAWLDGEYDAAKTLAVVAADALRNAGLLEHLRAITYGQSEGVLALDADCVITFANPAAQRLLAPADAGDLVGCRASDVFALERDGSFIELSGFVTAPGTVRADDATLCVGAKRIPVSFTANGLAAQRPGSVLVLHDITERKAFEEKLARLAFHDSLTGLANRRLFEDRIDHALTRARRHGTWQALLFFDLDRFKLVNDSYGHPAGDELLVQVSQLLQRTLRAEDTCARLGGDEFAVLIEDIASIEQVTGVADRLLEALSEGFTLAGHRVFVGASIGIATSEQVDSREELFAAADAAAYAAKAAGKGCYRVFDESTAAQSRALLELEAAMHRGLERGEFELYYQPLVDTHTGRVTGTEALVRWNSPDGLIPPNKFIPVAEETGLIIPLGAWVLEEACRQTHAWTLAHPERPPLRVSVNLSAHQFNRPNLVDEVADVLARTGLHPSQLCLEITETVVMANADTTIATLRALKDLGLRVAIDDFGTGYSSLSYLKRFPADVVKIDRAFTSGLGEHPVDYEIVAAVVRLCAAVGMAVVAEGVETTEQRQVLADLGCPIIQGYLIAKPLQAGEFAGLWSQAPTPL